MNPGRPVCSQSLYSSWHYRMQCFTVLGEIWDFRDCGNVRCALVGCDRAVVGSLFYDAFSVTRLYSVDDKQ
jgi:hypothetical protein